MMSWTVFRMVSVVVLVGWSVGIWGRPPPAEAQSLAGLTKGHAALVFDGSAADGVSVEALAVGGPVRCQAGQRVGVWVEQVPAGGLPRLQVEGCEVGMVISATPLEDGVGSLPNASLRGSGLRRGTRPSHRARWGCGIADPAA